MIRAHRYAVAAALAALLLVSVADVTGRYIFNAPVTGTDDLIRFGMAILVFGALPSVCRAGEHITVDLLTGRMPPAMRRTAERIFSAAAALILAYIAWRLYALGMTAVEARDRSPLLKLPYPPLIFFMAACAAAAAAMELIRAVGRRAPARP